MVFKSSGCIASFLLIKVNGGGIPSYFFDNLIPVLKIHHSYLSFFPILFTYPLSAEAYPFCRSLSYYGTVRLRLPYLRIFGVRTLSVTAGRGSRVRFSEPFAVDRKKHILQSDPVS